MVWARIFFESGHRAVAQLIQKSSGRRGKPRIPEKYNRMHQLEKKIRTIQGTLDFHKIWSSGDLLLTSADIYIARFWASNSPDPILTQKYYWSCCAASSGSSLEMDSRKGNRIPGWLFLPFHFHCVSCYPGISSNPSLSIPVLPSGFFILAGILGGLFICEKQTILKNGYGLLCAEYDCNPFN